MSRLAVIVAGCMAAAVLITVVAYFAFDSPVALLLPGAVIARHPGPHAGPPELQVARMVIVNVAVIAVTLGVVVGLPLARYRRR